MTRVAATSDTYATVAALPVVIESYGLEGLSRRWSAEFARRTTAVRLEGEGHVGVGEDDVHAR